MAERETSWTRAAPGWLLACMWLALPSIGVAQEGCLLAEGSTRLQTQPDPRGGSIVRLGTPHFECEDDVEIWADSAVAYSVDAMSILYGSVRYLDRQRELRADNARYFTNVGRLQAEGNVFITNHEDGSTVENGDLVYLRQTDYRPVEEMTVTRGSDGVRPRATVYPRRPAPEPRDTTDVSVETDDRQPSDTLDAGVPIEPDDVEEPSVPSEPEQYIVVGDRLFFLGDSDFNAAGTVEIVRDSLFAFADSAEYRAEGGELVLDGSARVEGSSYDLVGRTITLTSSGDRSDEVRALRDAVLTGEDLKVTAPRIVLELQDGELERMVAVPLGEAADTTASTSEEVPARPLALSEDIELTGDSLDLAAPEGVLERILAAGAAHSVSRARSSLNVESLPELARQDWIDADTIEVMLIPVKPDSAAGPADSSAPRDDYQVERIIARVGARSLYRLVPADSTAVAGVDPPAVSYMVADQITIFMVDGQADRVESVGQVSGWHLEPLSRSPEDAPADAAAADSTSVPGLGGDPAPDAAGNNRGDG